MGSADVLASEIFGIWPDFFNNAVAGIGDFNGRRTLRYPALEWKHPGGHGPADERRPNHRPDRGAADYGIQLVGGGIGDISQSGYSDIILRDQNGNVEILAFGAAGSVVSTDLTASSFYYSSASSPNSQGPATSGHFDQTWTVAGVGDFRGDGYASILWVNTATGAVGVTGLRSPHRQRSLSGRCSHSCPPASRSLPWAISTGMERQICCCATIRTGR